jgi:hypothetical protein
MPTPKKMTITKKFFFEDNTCFVKTDAVPLPKPSREWASRPKHDREVTHMYYDTHFFRAYGWTSKNGHEYVRVAVPCDEPGSVRTAGVDGWPAQAKQAFIDTVFGEVQQSFVIGRS